MCGVTFFANYFTRKCFWEVELQLTSLPTSHLLFQPLTPAQDPLLPQHHQSAWHPLPWCNHYHLLFNWTRHFTTSVLTKSTTWMFRPLHLHPRPLWVTTITIITLCSIRTTASACSIDLSVEQSKTKTLFSSNFVQ